ncbi:MAG: 1-acyl-sn-glycerol-3-phosphate acyltransferase [Acidobacteria bacterium]|nr:1-acyl-sn-glycerol-3-phosphate acyltransferase [Acidobacteriota bacterium]
MMRTLLMMIFWALTLPLGALLLFPWVLITGDVRPLYRFGMWGARSGVRLAGVRVQPIGHEQLDQGRTYIFMSNHISNIDPPLLLPLIPGRTSVMAKQELFRYPILGTGMRMISLVPVNRENRDAAIEAVHAAAEVVKQGIHMTVFVEGHRSRDGKLLPFKKGPFYLAEQCQVAVVPITIQGTHHVMPKGRFSINSGVVTVIFHAPIEPDQFGSRDALMETVRAAIQRGLTDSAIKTTVIGTATDSRESAS